MVFWGWLFLFKFWRIFKGCVCGEKIIIWLILIFVVLVGFYYDGEWSNKGIKYRMGWSRGMGLVEGGWLISVNRVKVEVGWCEDR